MRNDLLTKSVSALSLGTLLAAGCAAPVLARRDYDKYPQQRQEIALYNIQQILQDQFCDRRECPDVRVDEEAFYCRAGPAAYLWGEINAISCNEYVLIIEGKPDRSTIALRGTKSNAKRQCQDLAEAMTIYLEEKRK